MRDRRAAACRAHHRGAWRLLGAGPTAAVASVIASTKTVKTRRQRAVSAPSVLTPAVESAVRNSRFAVMLLVAAEAMLFTGLIGSFLVFRLGAPFWPPPGLPRLPLFVTWINTFVLLASLVTMRLAVRAARTGEVGVYRRRLALTGLFGTAFLAIQGSEWVRLVAHGLGLATGIYGSTFYTLIGCHAVHVTFAVLWMLWLESLSLRDGIRPRLPAIEAFSVYWYFVCAVWPILFILVYLW